LLFFDTLFIEKARVMGGVVNFVNLFRQDLQDLSDFFGLHFQFPPARHLPAMLRNARRAGTKL